MSAFWICHDCGKEYLGPDDIETADGMLPICYRCQELYNYCIACDMPFLINASGDPSGDLCDDCYESIDTISKLIIGRP